MDSQYLDLQFTTVQEQVPDFIYDDLKKYINESNSYHPQPHFLREILAKEHKVPADWVYLTNGVDEVIRIAIQAFGKNAHIFTPTEYSTFLQFCPSVKAHYSLVDDKYVLQTDELADASLLWLANPNNPIGYTEPDTIFALAQANKQSIVIVDEIYGEYAPQLSVIPAITSHPNLLVCKGFSKSYGLAGIRLGYIIGHPKQLAKMSAFAPWANVAYPSCGIAAIALEHKHYYQKLRDDIVVRKQKMVGWLTKQHFNVVPSFINTIVVKLASRQRAMFIVDELKKQNILINFGDNKDDMVGLPSNYISFVIGTDEQNNRLMTALAKIPHH